MKTAEFKKIIKPLIKQTVKEVLLEEGVLSGIVSEVAKGLSNQRLFTEGITVESKQEDLQAKAEKMEQERQEKIKRLNESAKTSGAFKNTRPIPDSGGHGPLSGVSSGDKGVDITAIQQIANGKWKALMG